MRYVTFIFVIIIFVSGAALCGCRSSHRVVEDSRTELRAESVRASETDSVRKDVKDTVSIVQAGNVAAHEEAAVEIERDSLGLPKRVVWSRDFTVTDNISIGRMHNYGVTQVRQSDSAQYTRKKNQLAQVRSEKAKEIMPGLTMEQKIGVGAICCVLLYLLYVLFIEDVWPWLKTKLYRK